MRGWVEVLVFGIAPALVAGSGSARGQVATGVVGVPFRIDAYDAAPGDYGMAFGSPSVGLARTYTGFSSPYGAGYGYGYAPSVLLPGRHGVGLWRPGFVTPGDLSGASDYRTYPVPSGVPSVAPPPPVGAYAPAFGPPAYPGR